MRKRKWCFVSVTMCMLLLTACEQKMETAEKKQFTEQSAEDKFKDRQHIDLGLFKVYYPESWKYDKENMQKEEQYAGVTFFDGETREDSTYEVTVSAESEEAYSFRKGLEAYGVELKDYADGKLETLLIGNAEYTTLEKEDSGSNCYQYRHEPSGVSYMVTVNGGTEDEEVKELLEGIWLELKDEGKTDAPWPWEGEIFQPTLTQQMVGAYTIVPEYIPFEEAQGTMQIMEHKFYKQGDQIFHLAENKLDTYEYSEEGMKFVSSMELDDEYEYISADPNGMLYLSQGIFEVIGVKDGQKALQTTITGDLTMHPSGEWGISFWVNSDTQKITNKEGNLTAAPWILTGLNDDTAREGPFSMLDDVEISNQHILVAGKIAAEEDNTKIIVYDYEGNQLMELGGADISDPDKLGSITGMAETENGFVAIDGNMRSIQFWDKEGVHVGVVRTEDIFGTDYPWLEDMQLLDDGAVLIMATQEREDGSANELMLFKLTGF
ncbi:hypothetical protein [Mediterraneibacter sp. ICN-202921]|uniref:hypothetical protein n=1 Tax=Mediterraneibacter sp. ICN-202921 TaxID=3134657 RepID=UPI000E5167B4|nr:hypothetical protein DWX08_12145 [Ruminococcus sp. AF18-22]